MTLPVATNRSSYGWTRPQSYLSFEQLCAQISQRIYSAAFTDLILAAGDLYTLFLALWNVVETYNRWAYGSSHSSFEVLERFFPEVVTPPRFPNRCSNCVYLGQLGEKDLYFHRSPTENHTAIAFERRGLSLLVSFEQIPTLTEEELSIATEIRRRAQLRGDVDPGDIALPTEMMQL